MGTYGVFDRYVYDIWWIDSMQWEYNLYSQQMEINLGVDKMEALTLLGIMLLSGYSRLPYTYVAGFISQNELIFTILWSLILWGRTSSMLS